jgi:hypothetical protein
VQDNLVEPEQTHAPRTISAAEAGPAPEVKDLRWPGVVMVLLILAAFWWPPVALAGAAVAWLIADREQAVVLAAVGVALLLLS